MIVHPDFFNHWKTQSLTRKLKDDPCAPLYVLKLWAHCQKQRTGTLSMSDEKLKSICGFPGDGATLREALASCEFIDQNPEEPTGFIVHQWERHNKTLINSWVNGSKAAPKKATHGIPTGLWTIH